MFVSEVSPCYLTVTCEASETTLPCCLLQLRGQRSAPLTRRVAAVLDPTQNHRDPVRNVY